MGIMPIRIAGAWPHLLQQNTFHVFLRFVDLPPCRLASFIKQCLALFVSGLARIHDPGFFGFPLIHWQQKNQKHHDSPDDLLPPAPGKPKASPPQRSGKADIVPANLPQYVCAFAEFKHGRTRASWHDLWMTTIPNGHWLHPCPTDQNSSLSSSRSTAQAPGTAHLARGGEQD